jgi:hypothetical protein
VTRLTVYRHFPDDDALFGACSAHWIAQQQLPDPGASFWTWRSLCIDHGLADTEAVDAMTGMVLALTWAGQPARGR